MTLFNILKSHLSGDSGLLGMRLYYHDFVVSEGKTLIVFKKSGSTKSFVQHSMWSMQISI